MSIFNFIKKRFIKTEKTMFKDITKVKRFESITEKDIKRMQEAIEYLLVSPKREKKFLEQARREYSEKIRILKADLEEFQIFKSIHAKMVNYENAVTMRFRKIDDILKKDFKNKKSERLLENFRRTARNNMSLLLNEIKIHRKEAQQEIKLLEKEKIQIANFRKLATSSAAACGELKRITYRQLEETEILTNLIEDLIETENKMLREDLSLLRETRIEINNSILESKKDYQYRKKGA